MPLENIYCGMPASKVQFRTGKWASRYEDRDRYIARRPIGEKEN